MDEQHIVQLRKKALQLPLEPGVYLMRDKQRNIIYIGKAKALKNRVTSYFRGVESHTPKTYKMVSLVEDFDYIITSSEFEALVLECSLIKQHVPKYNILLKDDKGYSYMRIASGPYPRITEVKQKQDDAAEYIGPYTSSFVVKQTVDEANKAFMLPTCNRKFPEDFGKGRPCLNFHLKQCIGLCRGKISPEEYRETVSQALDFIRGGGKDIIAFLEQQMEEAAEDLAFEKAARYRDRIRAIGRIGERQRVVFSKIDNLDVIAFVQGQGDTSVVLLRFRGRRMSDKETFLIGQTDDIPAARGEFLSRYYMNNPDLPKTVFLDGEAEDLALIKEVLTQKAGRRVQMHRPQRGEGAKLVEMARLNAAEELARSVGRTNKEMSMLDELTHLLGLEAPPSIIEAYDISNIGSETIVGSMVVFKNARAQKSDYKRFQVKETGGVDDYGAMREVLTRRFARYESEKGTGDSFGRLPDLLLMDGGVGHLNVALELLARFGFSIPVFGMVKDDRHRTRALVGREGELALNMNRGAFTLVSTIQNEAHRFAIAYSQKKHRISSFELAIRSVPGVGEKRAKALFKHFKTQKAMAAAGVAELCEVPGMSRPVAEKLYAYFREEPPGPKGITVDKDE